MRRPWRGGESMLPWNVIQVHRLLRLEVFCMVIDRTVLLALQYQCSSGAYAVLHITGYRLLLDRRSYGPAGGRLLRCKIHRSPMRRSLLHPNQKICRYYFTNCSSCGIFNHGNTLHTGCRSLPSRRGGRLAWGHISSRQSIAIVNRYRRSCCIQRS